MIDGRWRYCFVPVGHRGSYAEQLKYAAAEIVEAAMEEDATKAATECMDAIDALEGAIAAICGRDEAQVAYSRHWAKNRRRGYYDHMDEDVLERLDCAFGYGGRRW